MIPIEEIQKMIDAVQDQIKDAMQNNDLTETDQLNEELFLLEDEFLSQIELEKNE